jgi:hypothetical protein
MEYTLISELLYFMNMDSKSEETTLGNTLRARTHIGIVVPLCFLFLLLVGLLTSFHLMLIFKN